MNLLQIQSGYYFAGLLFAVLAFYQYGKKFSDRNESLLTAVCGVTAVWALLCAMAPFFHPRIYYLVQAVEIIRSIVTYVLLFSTLGLIKKPKNFLKENIGILILVGVCVLSVVPLATMMVSYVGSWGQLMDAGGKRPAGPYSSVNYQTWLMVLAIAGLVLLEQVLRNAKVNHRWHLKYLGIGLGAILCYDTYMYTNAILRGEVNPALWSVRGYIYALCAVLIGFTLSRIRAQPLHVNFSRKIVFHSSMLLLAGAYLLLMSVADFLLRTYASSWGEVQEVFFWGVAVLTLLVLFLSGRFRSYIRYYVTRNLFASKYDYREEWIRISKALTLSNVDNSLPERVVIALADCVDSTGGGIWLLKDNLVYEQEAQVGFEWVTDSKIKKGDLFAAHLELRNWVINLNEPLEDAVNLPSWLKDRTKYWLVIPLVVEEKLLGLVVLRQPRAKHALNWEDFDLLKAASSQAASYIGLMLATEALSEAKQFSAFNQMSAFVVHDLKTLNSQLSLMVANSARHKNNPSFIEDMIQTSAHVAKKLNTLLLHLKDRSGEFKVNKMAVNIEGVVAAVVASKQKERTNIGFQVEASAGKVEAIEDELATALGHLIQNAIDATQVDGKVEVRLTRQGSNVVIAIKDDGVGMSEEFIRKKLFRPFESTKGLAGMGVGTYQSRELIRRLGGDIEVKSLEGTGTEFLVILPVVQNN
jgi:putative PEP-CTERM system histidine kinase